MTFVDFVHAPRSIAISITIAEYENFLKPLMREFYSERDIKSIDDWCRFKYSSEWFLLCNLYERSLISTPIMYHNAVTFIERIPFNRIQL